MSNILI